MRHMFPNFAVNYTSISDLHSHEPSDRGIAPFHCCEKVFYSHANYIDTGE